MKLVRNVVVTAVVATCLWHVPANAVWVWTPETGRWINPARQPRATPEEQLNYARQLTRNGDYDEALEQFERFFEFYGDTDIADRAQFEKAQCLESAGEHLEASREYQKVIANWPDTKLFSEVIAKEYEIGDRFYELAREDKDKFFLFRNRNLKRAVEVYNQVIENQRYTEEAAEARYKIGLCYFSRGRYDDARFEYDDLLEQYPASKWTPLALYGLAMCRYHGVMPAVYDQERTEEALTAFQRFVDEYSDNPRVPDAKVKILELQEIVAEKKFRIAEHYLNRGRENSAKMYFLAVLEDYPETSWAERARPFLEESE